MKDPIVHLGDLAFEILEFCYSDANRALIEASAKAAGATLNQWVAEAIGRKVAENFEVQFKSEVRPEILLLKDLEVWT